ncbi:MAG: pantetheine-phosphate adenylyltransferase [Candidatus Auribacterota bacterium]|jgi:pantetheine-phosphate adenylyltransferase|uniref:Phosphopantetheine adenylyltransferase n=1 Tax=Candidatus Auribacter fodinae TaxID=2093366 RepID=A0A3A4QR25_9BACT|nr:MAG: pantetheine-phosphate adenylyltransferase [Candidatus Auribacter fodinae]
MNNTLAVYPGSFDPVTFGHIDIIERASRLYPNLIVAVLGNSAKKSCFSLEERTDMLRAVLGNKKGIEVDSFDGLLVTYMRNKRANILVRGLRAISDFEYEFQMALFNKSLDDNIETVFLMSRAEYSYVSSRLIKEIAVHGGDISSFVPHIVVEKVHEKLQFN